MTCKAASLQLCLHFRDTARGAGRFFLFACLFVFPWTRVALLNSLTLGNPAFFEYLFALQHWNSDWKPKLLSRSGIAADFLGNIAIRSPHYQCLFFSVLAPWGCSLAFHQFQLKTHSNPGWKAGDLYQQIYAKWQIIATFCFISLQTQCFSFPPPGTPPHPGSSNTLRCWAIFTNLITFGPSVFPADPGVCSA